MVVVVVVGFFFLRVCSFSSAAVAMWTISAAFTSLCVFVGGRPVGFTYGPDRHPG